MKKFLFVVTSCASLLTGLSFFLFPPARAAENPLLALLTMPAPPPPNPDAPLPPHQTMNINATATSNPPGDDAPIEELMEYWRSRGYNATAYNARPSDKVLGRIMAEIEKRPKELIDFVALFPATPEAGRFVKSIFDRLPAATEDQRQVRDGLRRWMTYNTPYYSNDLARDAAKVADEGDYVVNHNQLIALARVDWQRAGPIVTRLYNNPSQKASRTAALWALYVHALDSDSPSDVERYRDELKEIVADKSLTPGVRDLALDALSLEKEWSGRDEWYVSLMEDETMLDLGRFTGLTTLINNAPEDKYTDRMIALLQNDNINVRSAAARNLLVRNEQARPEVIRALLPWLENPKWLKEVNQGSRARLVEALAHQKIPESVPALIAALDEKGLRPPTPSNANAAVANALNAASVVANAAAMAASNISNARGPRRIEYYGPTNTAGVASNTYVFTETYPLRDSAIRALAFQADPRAVPALRKVLNETTGWQQRAIVAAIHGCGGYSVGEQVAALESAARKFESIRHDLSNQAYSNVNAYRGSDAALRVAFGLEGEDYLATHIISLDQIDEDLAAGLVARVIALDEKEPEVASSLRTLVLRWKGTAINALLLHDLKRNKIEPRSIVYLLAERKTIRERQSAAVFETRTAGPMAYGISACLLEDPADYDTILNGNDDTAKTAMLACARLIRAPLAVPKVAEHLRSKDKLLALAAERYLVSEDSPEARRIVLALHPGEATILGASTAFFTGANRENQDADMRGLFASVSEFYGRVQDHSQLENHSKLEEVEARLRKEVLSDPNLLGVYSWRKNFIHVYKDRVMLSWEDDPARYRERPLKAEEFDRFKDLITHYNADELPPYLSCLGEKCESEQLLMLGRAGGRRAYVLASSMPPLFAELDRMFETLRTEPATVKYWAARDNPGLQVLFADDNLEARTVWKKGGDLRVLVSDKVRETAIENEIEAYSQELAASEEDDSVLAGKIEKEKSRREYDNLTWYAVGPGGLGAVSTQPPDVDYIPVKDELTVPASQERWKARAGLIEVRTDEQGIYKISGGRMTQIRKGNYSYPVVSPNGRWVVACKLVEGDGYRTVRINLLTNREYLVETDDYMAELPFVFIPSLNRVLVGPFERDYEEYDGHEEEEASAESEAESGSSYALLDPETGAVLGARGEVRPLVQTTFRPLQQRALYEFWAAIPDTNATVIGIYNTRNFNIKPVLKLQKMDFDSMDLWVDESEGKAYFVYRGHLLSVPIRL